MGTQVKAILIGFLRPIQRLRKAVKRLLRDAAPRMPADLIVEIQAELEILLQAPGPLLLLHLHERHFLLSAELTKRQISFVRLASNPQKHLARLRRSGVDTRYVQIIEDNVVSLIALRKAANQKQIVCCAIDYRNRRGQKCYVNPAIIGFANRLQIPVVFVAAAWTEPSRAKLLSSGPHKGVDPVACAKSFVEFFNGVAKEKRQLRVKRYNEHTDWIEREKRLTKKPSD